MDESGKREMKRLAAGILAHVDAGKTTLSEGMLYCSGQLKKLGRVDHQNAFLDTDAQERERGITIFSKQAILPLKELEITLLDTPGHVDFSSEMERALQVMDCAVLVVSGADGVQAHTHTLWSLLRRYRIPVFLFVNKMDLAPDRRGPLLEELRRQLDSACVDFGPNPGEDWMENLALCGEEAMEEYLEQGTVSLERIREMIARRQLFPCYFGSALRLNGVDELLQGLETYARPPVYPAEFAAKVYKIARDPQGVRLTYLKITGGSLRVKDLLTGGQGEEIWQEKAEQIRIYSGAKYQAVEAAEAGCLCAVTGLTHTRAGQGLGAEAASASPVLEPALAYQAILPPSCDPMVALRQLRQLEEEDPQLRLVWNERLRQIHIQLMGQVQLEILQRLALERLGLALEFGPGAVVYRETIENTAEGVGHFEPLRHYAEIHLLLEPAERGSGLQFDVDCPEELLDRGWQRQALSHLEEKVHLGVLTGSPITDMKITLIGGQTSVKHTEGGDLRQAVYRAVRQGLMQAKSLLLEPWYAFRLELPPANLGRAMADIQQMGGRFEPPESAGERSLLTGLAPAAGMGDYARQAAAYSKGEARLSYSLKGYLPCHNQQEAIEQAGYDPERDLENPVDSVFCAHGAGFTVKWNQVAEYMHVESCRNRRREPKEAEEQEQPPEPQEPIAEPARQPRYSGTLEEDKELMAIYERTYGPIRRRDFDPAPKIRREKPPEPPTDPVPRRRERPDPNRQEFLLVDGYNIIFAWDELKEAAQQSLDAARQLLMDLLSNYQGYRNCQVILVFDAYKVPRNVGEVSKYHNIYVVYTKEAETADAYIEKTTYTIAQRHKVRVATSDSLEQAIILGHGALRISAAELKVEISQVKGQIGEILEKSRRHKGAKELKIALEKASGSPGRHTPG